MNATEAVVMLKFIQHEGVKYNESDTNFIDTLARMKPLAILSHQCEARVRSIYEYKTRNLEV